MEEERAGFLNIFKKDKTSNKVKPFQEEIEYEIMCYKIFKSCHIFVAKIVHMRL